MLNRCLGRTEQEEVGFASFRETSKNELARAPAEAIELPDVNDVANQIVYDVYRVTDKKIVIVEEVLPRM